MAKPAAAASAILLSGLAVLIILKAGFPDAGGPAAETSRVVPAFSAQTLNGEALTVEPGSGTPMIINFWATWCVPCIREMPLLETVHRRGIKVIGINAGAENEAQVRAWLQEQDITFTVVMDDPAQPVERLFPVPGLPSTFFVDGAGVIQQIEYGELTATTLDSGLTAIGVQ